MTILWYFNFIHIPMAIRAMFSDESKNPNQETLDKVDTAMLCFRLGIIIAWIFCGYLFTKNISYIAIICGVIHGSVAAYKHVLKK